MGEEAGKVQRATSQGVWLYPTSYIRGAIKFIVQNGTLVRIKEGAKNHWNLLFWIFIDHQINCIKLFEDKILSKS